MAAASLPAQARKTGSPGDSEADAAARLFLLELLLTSDDARESAQATVDWLAERAGARRAVCAMFDGEGGKVAHAHLHYLNPFPRNTGEVVGAYEKVLVPEINLGQLRKLIRAEFLVDAAGFNLVRGLPFRAGEVKEAIEAMP